MVKKRGSKSLSCGLLSLVEAWKRVPTGTRRRKQNTRVMYLLLAKEPVEASFTQNTSGGLSLWVWPQVTSELPSAAHAMPSGRLGPVLSSRDVNKAGRRRCLPGLPREIPFYLCMHLVQQSMLLL